MLMSFIHIFFKYFINGEQMEHIKRSRQHKLCYLVFFVSFAKTINCQSPPIKNSNSDMYNLFPINISCVESNFLCLLLLTSTVSLILNQFYPLNYWMGGFSRNTVIPHFLCYQIDVYYCQNSRNYNVLPTR